MSLESILVPVDGSSPSLAALAHALVLAEDSGAAIDILRVSDAGGIGTPVAEVSEENEEDLEVAIQSAISRLGSRISQLDITGDPLRTIVDTARAGHYDLIVLGTHGRIGRLHELLGSVAEGVVRNAPCPVLTVREADGTYQTFSEARHHRPEL
jgi:nucleotide-binding universal stress UspA family protein